MPKQIQLDHAAVIHGFIESAETLALEASPFEDTPTTQERLIYDRYIGWIASVRSYFEDKGIQHYLPKHFFMGERISFPYEAKRTPLWRIDVNKDYTRSRRFRQELCDAIKSQILDLKAVQSALFEKAKVIIIHIEKDGTIWREPKDTYFHAGKPKSNRTELLRHLAKGHVYVKTETLAGRYGGDLSLLAREKRKINELLTRKLKLPADVILGGKERRGRGYMNNPIYRLIVD